MPYYDNQRPGNTAEVKHRKGNDEMKIENAIKKLSKHGEVITDGQNYHAVINGYEVGFCKNGGGSDRAICFHICKVGLKSDPCSDYFPQTFFPNLTQAINAVI